MVYWFILVSTWMLIGSPIEAANYYYISTTGNDGNAGTEASPWRNPWTVSTRTFSPGDTIYVKVGTYTLTVQAWTGYNCSTVRITSSGTSGNPITIRNYPGDTVTFDVGATGANEAQEWPGIGSCGNVDWQVWDGFAIINAGSRGTRFEGDNLIVQNMTISQAGATCPTCACANNVNGLRIDDSTNITVKNNTIFNWHGNSSSDNNCTAITAYDSTGLVFEHNDIYNTNVAIYFKGVGSSPVHQNHTVRYNYIHDLSMYAFRPAGGDGDQTVNLDFHNNILVNMTSAIEPKDAGVLTDNQDFYNNTITGYTSYCFRGPGVGSVGWKYYNNLCYRSGSATYDVYTRENSNCSGASPITSVGNYNFFYRTTGFRYYYGLSGCAADYSSLASWKAAAQGLDQQSLSGSDPLFVGPLTSAVGFKLQAGSPAKAVGRVGGVGGGAVVDMGAYEVGTQCIGLESACQASQGQGVSGVRGMMRGGRR